MWVEQHILSSDALIKKIRAMAGRVAIITDSTVAPLYGKRLQERLKSGLIVFEAGEGSKTRETKAWIEDQLFEQGFGRDSGIVALGGGVVTDLAGFVAATYCRGIPFLSIPTTLLGMVDAALGGKTGVNMPGGKNMIGAFYNPVEVVIDTTLLETLPEKLLREGMAEVIKHAAIADKGLFERLKEFQGYHPVFLQEIVEKSARIKLNIVGQDKRETGMRRLLNFGHTIGHAIEATLGYGISHGEAVAIGMVGEAMLTGCEGPLMEMIDRYAFPLRLPRPLAIPALLSAMGMDKKALSSSPRFVQLEKMGTPKTFDGAYCACVAEENLVEVLERLLAWLNSR